MGEVLASGPGEMALLAYDAEVPEGGRDAAYALVALWHDGALLLVRERQRGCWELPGGGVEEGESARQAAVRELLEETGERVAADSLVFAGYATTSLGPERRVLTGALFTGSTARPADFTPTEEIAATVWWDGGPPPEGCPLQTVDTYLAALTRPRD